MNKVVGIRKVNYFGKKVNRQVTGKTVYFLYEDKETEGLAADNFFVSDDSPLYPKLDLIGAGDYVNLFYNRWGRIEDVQTVAPPASDQPKK